jgi:hypothetical protein
MVYPLYNAAAPAVPPVRNPLGDEITTFGSSDAEARVQIYKDIPTIIKIAFLPDINEFSFHLVSFYRLLPLCDMDIRIDVIFYG